MRTPRRTRPGRLVRGGTLTAEQLAQLDLMEDEKYHGMVTKR
jgi:hypothetical protein